MHKNYEALMQPPTTCIYIQTITHDIIIIIYVTLCYDITIKYYMSG